MASKLSGKGKIIIGMARATPDINFIGIEKYKSVLVKSVNAVEGNEKL